MQTKQFPRDVVWSAVSGTMLVSSFGLIHECIEHMAGGPVWTHQLPGWLDSNREKLHEAFPDLVGKPDLTPETYDEWRARTGEEYLSEMLDVPVFGGQPSSPFEGIPEGKRVAAVVVGSGER